VNSPPRGAYETISAPQEADFGDEGPPLLNISLLEPIFFFLPS